jgi:monoamine oxidase
MGARKRANWIHRKRRAAQPRLGDQLMGVVMADGTEHRADKVICTVPLGVLKNKGAMTFEPPLPKEMQEAIDEVSFPAGMRILFEMKEKFYPDLTSYGGFTKLLFNPDDLLFVYDPLFGKDQLSGKQHILAFVAVGNKFGGELGKLEDEELAKAALAKIDEMFNGQGTENYIKHVVQNWTREPHVLGAYSMSCKGHHREALGKTLHGNLIFAGEHTSKYYSLVPGAALSGRRAAVEAVSARII